MIILLSRLIAYRTPADFATRFMREERSPRVFLSRCPDLPPPVCFANAKLVGQGAGEDKSGGGGRNVPSSRDFGRLETAAFRHLVLKTFGKNFYKCLRDKRIRAKQEKSKNEQKCAEIDRNTRVLNRN
jgi:hypothetical protein